MKLKGKLIMSAAALAACAATLTSTTYAWYTTNTEVSANGISGATASSGDTSIFISKDHDEWGQTVTITSSDTNGNFSAAKLIPLQNSTAGAGFSSMKKLEDSVTAAANDVLTFSLYVKTAVTTLESPIDLYLSKFIVTATSVTEADNLLNGKTVTDAGATSLGTYGINTTTSASVTSVKKYGVDATRALSMTTKAVYAGGTEFNGLYDLANCGRKYDSTGAAQGEDVDALKYYNSVMGTTLAIPNGYNTNLTTFDSTKSYKIGEVDQTGNEYTTITFTIYLDGWDAYCFDACKGANFTIDLSFTTVSEKAISLN